MTTEAVAGFQSPEEAALDLELPLLGTLQSPSDDSGPITPRTSDDERVRRENHRAADRILLSPLSRGGCVGILGDVASLRRARIAADLAAALSAEKTSILVDADLGGAHLSFDERGRAQEGLVDVLRYGVRSPRVVAPTQSPGLNLLPVGSGTVDLASTWGSDAVGSLFAELRRTGDLVIVNGPDLTEMEAAGPFLQEVGAWILVHEFGVSMPKRTRALKDALGHSACLGILAIVAEKPKSAEIPAPPVAETAEASESTPGETPPDEAGSFGPGDASYAAFRPSTAALPEPPPWPPRESAESTDEEIAPADADAAAPEFAAPESETPESETRDPVAPEPEAFEPVEADSVPTESTSAGGAFEPIRAVPPERPAAEAPGREGLSDRYELLDEESIAVGESESSPPSRGIGSSRILVGVLLVASLAVAGLFWLSGGDGTPPAGPAPSDRLATGPPEVALPPASSPAGHAAQEPVAEEPVAQEPATKKPVTKEPAATKPPADEPVEGAPAAEKIPRPRSSAPPPATATPTAGTPAAPPLAASAGGAWGVHVTSMLTEEGAQRELSLLESAGFAGVARHVKVGERGFWFRIYVGPFDRKEDAQRIAREIKESGVRDYAMAQKIPGEGTGREDR